MGQKVNPIVMRLSVNKEWSSKWYAKGKEFADLLHEDLKIRNYITKELKTAAISKVVIERPAKKAIITIAPRSSIIASAVKKTLRDIGTLFPSNDKTPSEKAISVADGIAQPFNVVLLEKFTTI